MNHCYQFATKLGLELNTFFMITFSKPDGEQLTTVIISGGPFRGVSQ